MSTHKHVAAYTCWLILLLVLPDQSIAQSTNSLRHTVGVGAYFSRGDYGATEPTEIRYFPISYAVDNDRWGFQALVPRLQVTGLGNVLVNVGGLTRAVAGTQRQQARGLGDAIATLVYHMPPVSASAPFIDFRLDIKLPTADEEKALGTGETDYSLQMDLSETAGKNALFATIGHNFRGKSKLFPGLNNSTYVQLGIARPVTDDWNVGIFYDYRQAASSFSEESHELVPYVTWQISSKWSLTGLTSVGFTDASADYSVMGQLSYRW